MKGGKYMDIKLSIESGFENFKDRFDHFPYGICLIRKDDALTIDYLNESAKRLMLDVNPPFSLMAFIDMKEDNKKAFIQKHNQDWLVNINFNMGKLLLQLKCTQMPELSHYIVGLLLDISEYQSDEAQINRIIIEQTGITVLEWQRQLSRYYLSAGAERFGFYEHMNPHKFNFLEKEDIHPDDWKEVKQTFLLLQKNENQAKITVRLKDNDHSYLWCHLTFFAMRDKEGQIDRMIVTIHNVDEAVKNRQSLEYWAEYDPLTGYYNYGKFKEYARELINNNRDKKYALCYTDLKNFKFLNDIYGYEEGDRILKYWADKLNLVSREKESFARISSDHFATLRTYEDIEDLVSRFHHSVHELYKYQSATNKKFPLEVAAGFYLIKENDRHSIEDMLDRANIASKSVKGKPGSQYGFYDEHLRQSVIVRKELEAEMFHALKEEQFEVYFQPIVDIKNGDRVTAVEALVRWQHPLRGTIPPNDFIPLFERNGFIVDLDLYMFEKVCQYVNKNKITDMMISINVSRVSAFQSDFAKKYIQLKEQYQVPDGILELECTETTVVNNPRELNTIMNKLKDYGFLFAIDDFGSGYSSLNVLKEISTVDVLKLDRIFCTDDLQESRNHAIISSIITMAKKLDMKVIAEGVESLVQCDILKSLNCDYIQGYLFDRPMPISVFDKKYRDLKN